jgi:hypothetical protein
MLISGYQSTGSEYKLRYSLTTEAADQVVFIVSYGILSFRAAK